MKLRCKVFGHKPIQPFFNMPVYCNRCREDLTRDENGKWKVDKDIFEREFIKSLKGEVDIIEESIIRASLLEESIKEKDSKDSLAREIHAIRLILGPDATEDEIMVTHQRICGPLNGRDDIDG